MATSNSRNPEVPLCKLCHAPLNVRGSAVGEFCCPGCARVYDVLSGLSEAEGKVYFDAARRIGIIPPAEPAPEHPPEQGPARAAEPAMDRAPELHPDPDARRTTRFVLSGMSCPSCAWVAEQVLSGQQGVESAEVNFFSDSAKICYDMRLSSPLQLSQVLGPLGYTLEEARATPRQDFSSRLTLRFIICAILTMNIMSLAFVRYFEGLNIGEQEPVWLPWLELALLIPVLLLGWVPVLQRAAAAFRRHVFTMDLLIGISVATVLALSLVSAVQGRSDVYFETCAGLITISLFNRMVEARLRAKALGELQTLMRLQVVRVRVLDEKGRENYLEVNDVAEGMIVKFVTHESIPFDGLVHGDRCWINESVLTGEPKAIRKDPGDSVSAGSTVEQGDLRLRVTRTFENTRLRDIINSITNTLQEQESRLRSADRVARWFTPAVLAIALVAWFFRGFTDGWASAFTADGWFPSAAVLVVACPCAFSLAGVTAISATVGRLLRAGILVKEAHQLELLSEIDFLVFDKTGTLTEANMQVEGICWRDEERPELLPWIQRAERNSQHPVARAIRRYLEGVLKDTSPTIGTATGDSASDVDDSGAAANDSGTAANDSGTAANDSGTELRDSGTTNNEADDEVGDLEGRGRSIRMNNDTLLVGASTLFAATFDLESKDAGYTLVWFGRKKCAEGVFLLRDRIRAEARDVLSELRNRGLGLEILSGDQNEATKAVARSLGGIDSRGGLTLEEKQAILCTYRADGVRVAFVGDGTNDALAMSEASVSVAVRRATDEALGAAGFVLLTPDLQQLLVLFDAGKKLHSTIRGNYLWALGYNAVFIPIAVAGHLQPVLAMLLMLLSSGTVLLNSLRGSR